MAQKKLARFEAIQSFPNVLQYPEGMAGNWQTFFKNNHPIVLELACGRGEYTIGLARLYPQKNFIGMDLKGNRIYIGAKKCLEEQIPNACFLRSHIDKIDRYFNKGEAEAIWLTFPDPQLRGSRAKKRLTHPSFLRLYQRILVNGGLIHLKTDSPELFAFTLFVISWYGLHLHAHTPDAYSLDPVPVALQIKTHYENLDIARSSRIHYICFSLPAEPIPDQDDQLHQQLKQDEATVNRGNGLLLQ